MKYFKVITLGCRTNQYESQGYTDQLTQMGMTLASNEEEVDLCIVNTCTVTHSAESSSLSQIRLILRQHPDARVVVTGCMVEGNAEKLLTLDRRILVIPNQKKEDLVSFLFPDEKNLPEFRIQRFEAHTRAFVKVQDGCNSFCTYCIIPYVRGRSRSRTIKDVVEECRSLVQNGFKEIVLTGINVGDFEDGKKRLSDLVSEVDKIEGLKRLRISSIDPDEIDEALMEAVLHSQTTCPSMHVVLQSGSNVVLKRMNRKYTKQMFVEKIEELLQKRPDFTVTTDVIVGFPGESEEDFLETVDVVERLPFAKIHMFPYSPRKRTRAALYPDQIPSSLMQERKQRLLELAEKRAFRLREDFLGKTMTVLLEGSEEKEGWMSGYSEHFLRVLLPVSKHRPNDLVQVRALQNTPEGLIAEVI